jgi:hypothetical protein
MYFYTRLYESQKLSNEDRSPFNGISVLPRLIHFHTSFSFLLPAVLPSILRQCEYYLAGK